MAANVPLEIARVALRGLPAGQDGRRAGQPRRGHRRCDRRHPGRGGGAGRRPQRAHQPGLDQRRSPTWPPAATELSSILDEAVRLRAEVMDITHRSCEGTRGGPPAPASEGRTEADMTAQIIDGKAIAEQVRAEIVAEVEKLAARGVKPGVATILVGDDGGAQFYRGQIEKNTATVGFDYFNHTLPAGASQADGPRAHRRAQRRPRRARHPGPHADGRRDRPERRVQRHRAGKGPRLREPGQHRPRPARRLSVRAGDAVGLHRDPAKRRAMYVERCKDRASTSRSSTTRTSSASRPRCCA